MSFEAVNITARRLADQSTPAKLSDGRRVASQFFGQSSFLRHSIVSQFSAVICPHPEQLELYASLGCGFQTGAGTILNALRPAVSDSVLIFGTGTVGIAAIMASRFLGVQQIIAVDIVNSKLELAKSFGATHIINSKESADIVRDIHTITDGGVKYAIECTGASAVIERLLDCVICGGTAAIVGSPRPDFILKVDPEKLLHENKSLRGICQGDSVAKNVRESIY